MKETNFEEWLTWATSTNELGISNIEPVICKFLIYAEEEGKPMFIGKTWNANNWKHVSNSYRNMLTFLLLKNPLKYTYPILVGRSIKELDLHGVDNSLLEEALEYVPKEHWTHFFEEYLPTQKEDALSSVTGSGEEKLKWIYNALTRMIQLTTESKEPAISFEEYLKR